MTNGARPIHLIARDGGIGITIVPDPPYWKTKRIVLAPSLPMSQLPPSLAGPAGLRQRSLDGLMVQKLDGGIDVLFQASLLRAEQLSDVAYAFLKAAILK